MVGRPFAGGAMSSRLRTWRCGTCGYTVVSWHRDFAMCPLGHGSMSGEPGWPRKAPEAPPRGAVGPTGETGGRT